jgi:hypothetical protein
VGGDRCYWPPGVPARVRARVRGAPAKNPVSVCRRGLPPPIGPKIHPNRPRKQETKYERNHLAARSVLTWYSSSQYPNCASDFRPCRTSTPVPVTSYRSYPPAFHSLVARARPPFWSWCTVVRQFGGCELMRIVLISPAPAPLVRGPVGTNQVADFTKKTHHKKSSPPEERPT